MPGLFFVLSKATKSHGRVVIIINNAAHILAIILGYITADMNTFDQPAFYLSSYTGFRHAFFCGYGKNTTSNKII